MDKKMVVHHSKGLDEDLVVNVYGTAGQPVMVFAPQGQDPENLEDVGLVDELAEYVDAGAIQLFCVSSIDNETWGGTGDATERAARQEAYYQAVCDEIVPLVHEASGTDARLDLFQGCMCLSGVYDSRRYFGDWMDATLYDNTPCAFLPNMPADHPYVALYNKRQLLFCSGQEASEAESLRTTREIDANLVRLGVDAWCDYWGGDVSHTWYWWKKQVDYFLPIVLEDVEKATAEEATEKKPAARKRATTRKPTTRKTTAKKATAEKKPAAEKTAAAKKPAAKAAAPIAKAEKPATPAKATKAATPVKAEKPAAPAEAVKPAVPAKAEDAPAKAEPAAKKATTRKTTAKAVEKAKPKTAAKPETKAAEPKVEEPKATEAKPAAKKATAKKATAAKSTTTKSATTKATATKPASTKATSTKKRGTSAK